MLEFSEISVNSDKFNRNNNFSNDFEMNFDNSSIRNENDNDISFLLITKKNYLE